MMMMMMTKKSDEILLFLSDHAPEFELNFQVETLFGALDVTGDTPWAEDSQSPSVKVGVSGLNSVTLLI